MVYPSIHVFVTQPKTRLSCFVASGAEKAEKTNISQLAAKVQPLFVYLSELENRYLRLPTSGVYRGGEGILPLQEFFFSKIVQFGAFL